MKKPSPIYQLKVTLADSKPPIWRRFLVASDMDLGLFHAILQACLSGWLRYPLRVVCGLVA